jgi:hypothetical protein
LCRAASTACRSNYSPLAGMLPFLFEPRHLLSPATWPTRSTSSSSARPRVLRPIDLLMRRPARQRSANQPIREWHQCAAHKLYRRLRRMASCLRRPLPHYGTRPRSGLPRRGKPPAAAKQHPNRHPVPNFRVPPCTASGNTIEFVRRETFRRSARPRLSILHRNFSALQFLAQLTKADRKQFDTICCLFQAPRIFSRLTYAPSPGSSVCQRGIAPAKLFCEGASIRASRRMPGGGQA